VKRRREVKVGREGEKRKWEEKEESESGKRRREVKVGRERGK
jgi:hypothetical protein